MPRHMAGPRVFANQSGRAKVPDFLKSNHWLIGRRAFASCGEFAAEFHKKCGTIVDDLTVDRWSKQTRFE